jgi:hypothetical protein
MKAFVILLLLLTGCAAKKPIAPEPPGHVHYTGCRQISVNYSTDKVMVECPLHPEVKK